MREGERVAWKTCSCRPTLLVVSRPLQVASMKEKALLQSAVFKRGSRSDEVGAGCRRG